MLQLGRVDVDAVVSDVRMPVMNGIELAFAVLDRYPFLPLLFVTASEVPHELLERPTIRLLRKPPDIMAIEHQLDELIEAAATPERGAAAPQ